MLGFKKLTMEVRNMNKLEKIYEELVKESATGIAQDPETGEPLFDRYEEEGGDICEDLTVSSEGFCLLSDKLEELFELFGFSRTRISDDNENGLVEFDDKLDNEFSEIRIDLIEAFDKAVKRLGEESK